MWQGTHHSAQKPTTTGSADAATSASQVASVNVSMETAVRSAEMRLDQLDQVVAGDEPDALLRHLAPLDDEEGRQGGDVVVERHVLVLLDVDLAHAEPA